MPEAIEPTGPVDLLHAILPATGPDLSWQMMAACKVYDVEVFFPGKGKSKDAERAIRICEGCSVQNECLDYSLQFLEQQGIQAGLSEVARRKLRKKRTINT